MKPMHIDRTAVSVSNLTEERDEREYWWTKSPTELMQALEMMRQITYEYDPVADRIPRILEVLERPTR